MYQTNSASASIAAESLLSVVARWFELGLRDGNQSSVVAQRERALRDECLAAAADLRAARLGLPTIPASPAADWTPLEVLAATMPPIAGGAPFQPTREDWDDYAAWSDSLGAGPLTDADHIAVHGCC